MNPVAPNLKAEKFEDYNKKHHITFFKRFDEDGKFDTVVFATAVRAEGGVPLGIAVITDNSLYTMVRACLGVEAEGKRGELLRFLDKMNDRYPMFKFYIDEENTVCMDSCCLSDDKTFQPLLVHSMVEVALVFLQRKYQSFTPFLNPQLSGTEDMKI